MIIFVINTKHPRGLISKPSHPTEAAAALKGTVVVFLDHLEGKSPKYAFKLEDETP